MQLRTFEKNSMGTRVTVSLYSGTTKEEARISAERAFDVFRDLEGRFSTYLEDSEISFINKNAGETVQATTLMIDTIAYALTLAKETGGIFNPLVGLLTTPEGISKKTAPFAHLDIKIDLEKKTVSTPAGTALDLNSIVKGMAIDMALDAMPEEENLMIEAGGDIRLKGLPPGENTWKIGIRNPMDPKKIITVLNLRPGAICTTGGYFREEKAAREKRFHLVNPRDDKNKSIAVSMTVIAATAKEADALSTAAFFMDIGQAVQFVESHPGASCLIIDLKNNLFASDRMKSNFLT